MGGRAPIGVLPHPVAGRRARWPATATRLLCFACSPAPDREPADVLITGGTVITMDAGRRVLEDGAVAVVGDRIAAVGSTRELEARYRAREVLDARRMVVMPGLIDGHGHAGHGLVKSLGTDTGEWYGATEAIYARGSTVDFWRADALLTALERLRFGVTTGLTLFGGGDSVMRTDDPRYGDAYLQAIQDVGVRWFLAVGPRRPPFPRTYTHWDGETATDVQVSFERQLEVSEALIRKWHGAGNGRVNLAVMFPTHHPQQGPITDAAMEELRSQARATRELSRRHGLLFTQDGHTRGTVKSAHEELDLLGPDALLSLATELTDAGVTVMLGSDGVAPDRSYDMFRHMFQAMRYHRFHFRDPAVLPAGKVLEMVTVDAARALGLEHEIGSLEPGKKADIILLDMFRPHLMPMNMPLYRVAYFANGNDVATVLVDGRILMREGRVLSVDEAEALELAQREADAAIRRTGLEHLTRTPEGFWGKSRLP